VDQVSASFRSAHASTMTAQSQLEKAKADLNAAIATERNAQATAAKDVANEANARDHCVMIPMCALKKG
jgi:peptidoglycan hydrolase CwlO-like protein